MEQFDAQFQKIREGNFWLDGENWKRHLENGSDKIRFEYRPDRNHKVQYMRAVQCHSRGIQTDPDLQSVVLIPYGITDCIDHVESMFDYKCISERGVIAGGLGVRQKNTGSHERVNVHSSMRTERSEKPKKMPYTLNWGRMHDAVPWFDLKTTQHKGLVFWQTITKPTIKLLGKSGQKEICPK